MRNHSSLNCQYCDVAVIRCFFELEDVKPSSLRWTMKLLCNGDKSTHR